MRMNALEVAQDIKMNRCCFQRLRLSFAKSFKMPLRSLQFGIAQLGFFCKQLVRLFGIAGHEYAESDPQAFEDTLMESR